MTSQVDEEALTGTEKEGGTMDINSGLAKADGGMEESTNTPSMTTQANVEASLMASAVNGDDVAGSVSEEQRRIVDAIGKRVTESNENIVAGATTSPGATVNGLTETVSPHYSFDTPTSGSNPASNSAFIATTSPAEKDETRLIPQRYTISGDIWEEFAREMPRSRSTRATLRKSTNKFPEDSYSFIALNGPEKNCLWSDRKRLFFFLFGLLPFLFQMVFLLLLVWSQTDESRGTIEETDNPDKEKDGIMAVLAAFIPANANPIVRTAQVTSIAAYVIFADSSLQDIIRAFQCFPYSNGTDGGPVQCMRFSCILRGIQGTLAMIVTLLLILTSNTVVDIILNFTAVSFISEIDDYAFQLALAGEFNQTLEAEAERITKQDLPPCLFKNKSSKNTCKFIVSCVVSLILFGMMAFVSASQDSLNFWVTTVLRVQFQESTGLNPYSGCFMMNKNSNQVYFSRRSYHSYDTSARNSSIAYCREDRQWVLYRGDTSDPCDAASKSELLLARSSKTDTFDISTSFEGSWFSASNTPLNLYFFDTGGNDAVIEEHCDSFLGDGNCDLFFNELGYDFDGGDCCSSTCSQTKCGRGGLTSVFGDLTISGDGFENCVDPTMFPITIHLNGITSSRDSKFTGIEDWRDIDRYSRPWSNENGFEEWMEAPPVSPYFNIDCDGKNVMTAYIEESMDNESHTVMVEDGAACTLVIRNATTGSDILTDEPIWMIDYTLFHQGINEDESARVEILTNSSAEVESVTFSRIPECYFRKLENHTDLHRIYTHSGKSSSNKAIDWLLGDYTGNSECEDDTFIERYALINMYFAMNTSKGFLSEDNQCTWPSISCSNGNVAKIQLKDAGVGGDIPSELSLLLNLEKLQLMSCDQVVSLNGTSAGSQLIDLDLSKSRIPCYSVPPELWDLSSLQVLKLNDNYFSSIPTDIRRLSNLQRLALGGNALSVIPTEIGTLSSLKALYLESNDLFYIPTEIGRLSNLSELNLGGNSVSGLPLEIWNVSSLQVLDLRDNDIYFLPEEIGSLFKLQELDLAKNKIESLPMEIWNLSSLQTLNLGWNLLSSLPTEIGYLSKLKELDLERNILSSLPQEIWNISSIQVLGLSDVGLSSFPVEIKGLSNLEDLDLSFNVLGSLPSEIVTLSSLKVLDLSFAGLTSLPTEIGQLTSLQRIYLEEQASLTYLPTEIGNLSNLRQLNINDNGVWTLPTEIANLFDLQRLNLDGNALTDLPMETASLSNLRELRIGRNSFTSLPPVIGALSNLEIFSLSYNSYHLNLTNQTEIWSLSKLKGLSLSEIGLINLPTEIGGLSRLQELDLRSNELINLPTEIGALTNLESLILQYNQLTSIPREIENLSNLRELYLIGNRFNFTCDDLPDGLANLCITTGCYLYSGIRC